jgi:hypothetical protein
MSCDLLQQLRVLVDVADDLVLPPRRINEAGEAFIGEPHGVHGLIPVDPAASLWFTGYLNVPELDDTSLVNLDVGCILLAGVLTPCYDFIVLVIPCVCRFQIL